MRSCPCSVPAWRDLCRSESGARCCVCYLAASLFSCAGPAHDWQTPAAKHKCWAMPVSAQERGSKHASLPVREHSGGSVARLLAHHARPRLLRVACFAGLGHTRRALPRLPAGGVPHTFTVT